MTFEGALLRQQAYAVGYGVRIIKLTPRVGSSQKLHLRE